MSTYTRMGTITATVIVSLEPNRSGNFICDATADHVEINAALTYVNVLGGGKVVVLEGAYSASDTILIYSNTTFELHGSITLANGSNVNLVEAATTPASYIIMINGYYDGNGANQTADMSTIYMEQVGYSKFVDFYVTGGHRHVAVRGEGLELYNSDNNIIRGLHVFGNQYDGVKMRNGSLSNTVTGCVFWDNWASGVQCSSFSHRNTIVGNIVWTTDRTSNPLAPYCRGFTFHEVNTCVIADNIVYNVNRGILILTNEDGYCNGHVIEDNVIVDSEYGMYITMTGVGAHIEENNINHNIFYNIDTTGFHVANCHFKYNMVESNIFYDMTNGVDFTGANNTDNIVRFNKFRTVTNPITDGGSDNWYHDNIGHIEYDNITCYSGGTFSPLDSAATEYCALSGNTSPDPAENNFMQVVPCDGIFKNFYVKLDGAPGAGNSYTFALRRNGVTQAITVTISGGDTEGNDLANTVAVSAGDTINFRVVPADNPTVRHAGWSIQFVHAHPDAP